MTSRVALRVARPCESRVAVIRNARVGTQYGRPLQAPSTTHGMSRSVVAASVSRLEIFGLMYKRSIAVIVTRDSRRECRVNVNSVTVAS